MLTTGLFICLSKIIDCDTRFLSEKSEKSHKSHKEKKHKDKDKKHKKEKKVTLLFVKLNSTRLRIYLQSLNSLIFSNL